MLGLLGLATAQVIGTPPPCPNGRLIREVSVARYSPWCCAGESYVWFDDLASAHMEEMMGKYVTVAPQSDTSREFPTPAYLIANDMTLEFRNDGNRTWENETAGTLHPYLYLAYSSYPIDYPPNEPPTANTYYSIGANRDSAIYNAHTNQDGPAVFRIYADECPFPPSTAAAAAHRRHVPRGLLAAVHDRGRGRGPVTSGHGADAHHQGRRLLHARRL